MGCRAPGLTKKCPFCPQQWPQGLAGPCCPWSCSWVPSWAGVGATAGVGDNGGGTRVVGWPPRLGDNGVTPTDPKLTGAQLLVTSAEGPGGLGSSQENLGGSLGFWGVSESHGGLGILGGCWDFKDFFIISGLFGGAWGDLRGPLGESQPR